MSILKTIGDKITGAKKKYAEIKKDARPITKSAKETFDYILPPLKKKKAQTKKTKMTKKTCKCRNK